MKTGWQESLFSARIQSTAMKVGLISFHSFINPGGVKNHVLNLFKEYKKRKIWTKIIVPRRNASEYYGKDVILLGTSFPVNFGGSVADFDINFNPLAVEDVLAKEKFDVLHFHNLAFPSALQIVMTPSALDTLKILTFHSNLRGSKFLRDYPAFFYALGKSCNWAVDGVIAVAPLILEFFKDYSGPKTIIPNGISLDDFNPRKKKIDRFLDGKINILFVGRIEERKGLIYLLKAFKILKQKYLDIRLIVVGKGSLEGECHTYVRENRLDDVVFEGEKTKEVPSYYATADIYVSPAIFGESFGIVLLEAMASATPVVCFSNKGYAQLMKGKTTAKFMAEPRDYRELAKKIEILIKDAKLRKEIGKKGLIEVEQYSWEKVADQVLDFYKSCYRNKLKKKKIKFSLLE